MAYWRRVGATTGLVAIGLQSLVEFSLQMPGNAVFCVVLMAIALHESPSAKSRRHNGGPIPRPQQALIVSRDAQIHRLRSSPPTLMAFVRTWRR